jgi:gentisate 1,2-dioxygenase
VLWSLLNSIPAKNVQRPHRHNSVALDLAVAAKPGVYTLMGKEIDTNGDIVDPIRCDWTPGGVFVTPPGWWHSHHNESDEVAWVLPMQDAGLYTHQRTLDIRFVDDELALHRAGRIRGSAFAGDVPTVHRDGRARRAGAAREEDRHEARVVRGEGRRDGRQDGGA